MTTEIRLEVEDKLARNYAGYQGDARMIRVGDNLQRVFTTHDGREYLRQMQSYELQQVMGIRPGHHWPQEGMPRTMIGNVAVTVLPFVASNRGRGAWHQRAVAECPVCGKVVNAGKLAQHLFVHTDCLSETSK